MRAPATRSGCRRGVRGGGGLGAAVGARDCVDMRMGGRERAAAAAAAARGDVTGVTLVQVGGVAAAVGP